MPLLLGTHLLTRGRADATALVVAAVRRRAVHSPALFPPVTGSRTAAARPPLGRRLPPPPTRRFLSSSPNPTASNALEDVIVTNSCIKQIKALQAREKKEGLKLRLSVEGGGCSGFTYTFTTEDGPAQEDDKVFGRDGAQVLVDEGSLEFVRGSTVDFTEDMMRSAFAVVNNPLSESACGCGSSFAIKNFEKNPAID